MNRKLQTIKAFEELIYKYENPFYANGELKSFFNGSDCPLCQIHSSEYDCTGCPLAHEDGDQGCHEFNSNDKAYDVYWVYKYMKQFNVKAKLLKAFQKRANFFKKYLPIIEKLPASRFTKKGWKYFSELDRND